MTKFIQQLYVASCFTIIFCSNSYAESPIAFEWVLDSSHVNQNHNSGFATRSLFSINYKQSFDFAGGTLTPQIAYSAFRGRNGSDLVGDVQGFSNIDAEHFSAWQEISLNFESDNFLLRIGQLDANANFASLEHAGNFINASFGLTPTAFVLPTYPDMEYGGYGQYQTSDTSYLSVGYYRPDEVDESGEQHPLWMLGFCLYCNDKLTIQLGYWRIKHSDTNINNVTGQYAFIEGEFAQNWQGFALYSSNNVNANLEIKHHLKIGLTHQPSFAPEHQIGLAYSRVIGPVNETAFELYYLWPITENIILQPDFQWINDSNVKHANSSISTLRVIVSF